jgi:hypothetical protein
MTHAAAPRQPLTPHAALGWLRSLSIDIEAAAVLDADGEVLAGDRSLAGAQAAQGLTVARSDRRAIVLRVGPRALQRLVRADVEAALEAVESR